MKAVVEDTIGRKWEVDNWHDLPVPSGVTPSAFLFEDGSLIETDELIGPPEGATHWMILARDHPAALEFAAAVN